MGVCATAGVTKINAHKYLRIDMNKPLCMYVLAGAKNDVSRHHHNDVRVGRVRQKLKGNDSIELLQSCTFDMFLCSLNVKSRARFVIFFDQFVVSGIDVTINKLKVYVN